MKGLTFEIARSLGSRQGGGRMEEHARADIALPGDFRFDRRRSCLLRQGENGALSPVVIGSRVLDILGLLIDRDGDLISRDEILESIWPGWSRAPMSRCKSRRFAASSAKPVPTGA